MLVSVVLIMRLTSLADGVSPIPMSVQFHLQPGLMAQLYDLASP